MANIKKIVFLLVTLLSSTMMSNMAQAQSRFTLTSPAFQHNQTIPARYTCQGEDINPALMISGIPEGTKSLALIVDDPDAPGGMWVHWVAYNIPLVAEIAENSKPGVGGMTDFGRTDYGGPCPPSGTHRYFFKLYALDQDITPKPKMTKQALENAMKGHIIAETNLMGTYQKK